ncbi:GNAT family N-acetyltransferase [Paraburkholderia sp. A3RO-2L]|jgi:GNAT superfamily N-acetyltransferase|uniref:GNAT family N-acetyltransferase n=1 Tax=Paraburkholderia sp. A3RO-2L TaxID=3028376 RepID=UPI003DA7CD5D
MRIESTQSFVAAFQALPMLKSLDEFYPDLSHWYLNTVVPGLVLGNDVLLLAREGNQTLGLALGKRSDTERKLRCVRVLPEAQNTGIGLKLIETMFEELETEKPHCTVAEEMLGLYSRAFVNRYGFALNSVDKGRFRPGKLEYVFN